MAYVGIERYDRVLVSRLEEKLSIGRPREKSKDNTK